VSECTVGSCCVPVSVNFTHRYTLY